MPNCKWCAKMGTQIKYLHLQNRLPALSLMLLFILFGFSSAQRVAPGVPPQHYQQVPVQHNPQAQYQQQQPPPPPPHQQQQQQQVHHAPNVPPQTYQQPQQPQYQQVPVQQQQQQPQQQQYQQPQQVQQPIQQQQQQFQQQPPQPAQQQHPPQAHHQAHHGQQQVLNTGNIEHERAHIQEHMQVPIDTSKMSEAELQFHYFKMHDSDNNNKLDGCELIKSLIHWHEQGSKEQQHSNEQVPHVEEKIFSDEELVALIDPILQMDDTSHDGYIDYPEFIKAQQRAVAASQQKQQQQQSQSGQ